MAEAIKGLIKRGGLIPLGSRRITRSGLSHERFNLWLPEQLNDLWREIWRRKLKVNIYIEIPRTPKEV